MFFVPPFSWQSVQTLEVQDMAKGKNGLQAIALNAVKLTAFAPIVIAMRIMKIGAGGARGKSESRRMVGEKMKAASDATLDAAQTVLTGHPGKVPGRTLALYQKRVTANFKRLLSNR
jgi:hypothetical protein